jgi:hypothetical protein
MKADGLSIAHPSLPIGSKVQVTNVATGKKIDVTVTGRIPASSSRIVDLSPGAASALELQPNGTVLISVPQATRPRPTTALPPPEAVAKEEPAPEPAPEEPAPEPVADVPEEKPPEPTPEPKPEPPPEPAKEEPAPEPAREPAPVQEQRPLSITVNNYLTRPEETPQPESVSSTPIPKSGADTDFLAWLYSMDARSSRDAMDARDARDVRDGRDARDVRDARDARDADIRDARDVRDVRDARDVRDVRDARDARDSVARAQPQTQSQPASPMPQTQIIQIIPNTGTPVSPSSQTMYIQGSPAPAAPAAPAQVTPAQPAQPAQTYQPQTYTPPPVVQVNPNPAPSPVPAGDVEIIGLPDRSSGKIYRLQVGAYSTQSAAVKAAQLVQAAGLNPVLEQYDSKYRVLAVGIAAANVYPACLRLGSMGFRQIWVRE